MKQSKSGKAQWVLIVKFFSWCKKHFKLDNTTGNEILVSLKDDRRIIFIESYFALLKSIHEKTGHGERDKIRYEFNQHYYWLPSAVINLFLHVLCLLST